MPFRNLLVPVTPRIEILHPSMARVLRAKTPGERLRIGFSIWASAKRMVRAHVSSARPGWTEAEVAREVARRMALGS